MPQVRAYVSAKTRRTRRRNAEDAEAGGSIAGEKAGATFSAVAAPEADELKGSASSPFFLRVLCVFAFLVVDGNAGRVSRRRGPCRGGRRRAQGRTS